MDSEPSQHRELTLMFTDIVGYSRLMGRDEALTIEMLGDYRKILLAHIEENSGVFIEFAGDAIFSRFDTALSAVNAAVAIQKHLQLFNQGRDKDLPALRTRIGLHKGAVLLRENAVLGDDVNIAARLEPLAVPDGICISKAVYDDIKTDLREPIKPLGIQSLKNIEQKIRAYLIKPTGLGWRDHFHYFWLGCTKKINAYRYPIIATFLVLIIASFYFIPRWLVPGYAANYVEIANFQNLMNADGKSDYFSSGITEAVRSQLADMRDVYIVEADKGIHAPIRLEGSVQKIGDNLRIVYRVFRRKGNVQIAGGKLDGAYQDIFILQDRLVGDIARNLASEFKLQNFRPAPLKLTNDITAYDYYLQGMDYLGKPSSQENFDAAIQNFNEALVHDNQFMLANSGLCEAFRLKYESTKETNWIEKAENHCLKALTQDEKSEKTSAAIGTLYAAIGKYAEATKFLEQAIEKNPENIRAIIGLAEIYSLIQDNTQAEKLYLEAIKKAPKNWETYQGYGYFLTRRGRYDEAIKNYQKVLKITPDNSTAMNNIAINFFYKDEFNNAAKFFEEAAKLDPISDMFINTGNMYYCSGQLQKAIQMFEQAIQLQPTNYRWMAYLADAYKFLPNEKKNADSYAKESIELAHEETIKNPNLAQGYHYLARGFAYFGELKKAEDMLVIADKLDPASTETLYIHLRVAILKANDDEIRKRAQDLLDSEYSYKLLLADPDFAVLKEMRFKDLSNRKK